jgi:SulP family sulfate permease
MAAFQNVLPNNTFLTNLREIPAYFLRPVNIFRCYDRSNLRPDLIAGLTIGIILLPQAIAFALVAELPPQMGLYAAIVGAVIGALWGSSNQVHTGPTNAISLLVLSVLLTIATPGTPEFVVAAGMLAVMVGVFQLALGLARMGVLVNFVSHSVVVGFTGAAGGLIAVNQLRHLLGLEFSSHGMVDTLESVRIHLLETHWPTASLGIGTMILIVLLQKINPKLPAALISLIISSTIVFFGGLDKLGVNVIGQLPSGLPPLAKLPLFDLEFIAKLSTGALAVGAIGLVETIAISRSISAQTGQRLDSNQEFMGQGLANISVGLLSGYPAAGSFSRSAVNFKAGAQTSLSAIFSSGFVLIALFLLAPLAAYLPRAALAGVLIVIAYGMIDRREITRIWRGARGDAVIMIVTFLATLFLHLEFAVLTGILFSFAVYIMRTSVPRVRAVLPDENFKHFVDQGQNPPCPQLVIIDILGDLYFGAVSHVEKAINRHRTNHPGQRFLMLRMHSVNQCDFSGIHALESVVRTYRDQGGDVFLVRVRRPVLDLMKSTGFYDHLGAAHFLTEDEAITYLFYRILDPAICIYECDVRAFIECQNLPKRLIYSSDLPPHTDIPLESIARIAPHELWQKLRGDGSAPLVIDVREPREFKQGHIPQAQLLPLPQLLSDTSKLALDSEIVVVCRGGRRSTRATYALQRRGYQNVRVLQGGMLAWEAAGLLEAIEHDRFRS